MGKRRPADVASAVHHTDTAGGTWDGPAAVSAMPNDQGVLTYCHAWHEEGATDVKAQYKFPHHKTDGGPAFTAACSAGLGRLDQADIPEADRAGVREHLQAHLDDADGTGNHHHPHVHGGHRAAARFMARMPSYLPGPVRRARAAAASAGEAYVRDTPFWSFRDAAIPDTTDLMIYSDIGFSWFDDDGVTAASFARDLASVTTKNIRLLINSPGGDVFDGIAIANLLRDWTGTVSGRVDGLCASIATVILMACDRIEMGRNTQAMIHDASGFCFGNPADMAEMHDLLNMISDNIAGAYADRAGGSVRTWRDRMTAETWYTAQDFVDAGLADLVTPAASENDGPMTCPDCQGTGKTGGKTCQTCGGAGEVMAEDTEDAGKTCDTCGGSGKIRSGKVTCPDCGGTGTMPDSADDLADIVRHAYAGRVAARTRYQPPARTPEPVPAPSREDLDDAITLPAGFFDSIREATAPLDVPDLRGTFRGLQEDMPEQPVPPAAEVVLPPRPEPAALPGLNPLLEAIADGLQTASTNQLDPGEHPAPSGPADLGPPPELPPLPVPELPVNPLADLIGSTVEDLATRQPEPETPAPVPEPLPDNPPIRLDLKDVQRALTEARY